MSCKVILNGIEYSEEEFNKFISNNKSELLLNIADNSDMLEGFSDFIDNEVNIKTEVSDLFENNSEPYNQLYSQYLKSLNKPNTNPILLGNQQEQVKKFTELQERLNNPEFIEGAKFAYENSEELQQLGTQEQYSKYLDAIFPDSKVEEMDDNLYISVLNDLKSQKIIDKQCS